MGVTCCWPVTFLRAIISDPGGTVHSAPQNNPVSSESWKLTSAEKAPAVRALRQDFLLLSAPLALLFPRATLCDISGSTCTKCATQITECHCDYCTACSARPGMLRKAEEAGTKIHSRSGSSVPSPSACLAPELAFIELLQALLRRHLDGRMCDSPNLILEWERWHSMVSAEHVSKALVASARELFCDSDVMNRVFAVLLLIVL